MSKETKKDLRNLMLYQVYVRNHSESGDFKGVLDDLDRIKELGTDILYLIPIHEIGQKKKKGDLGCPYSIKDYRSINHEYGTLEDFKLLVEETHKRDMQIMIDVVYNHTSHDSVLLEEHPEYFYKNEDGDFANRVGDWWDITDLDYSTSYDLWEELIDTLVYWTKLGVDGYRFDVASMLPLNFLEQAREELISINPDIVLLSESVHGGMTAWMRRTGHDCLCENEVYQVFDMAYDYDSHPYFEGYLEGKNSFNRYVEFLQLQEEIYPDNYIKMRNLENHDFGRFAPMVANNPDKIDIWTALVFFMKGSTMIYAGQEKSDTNKPSLFDRDLVNWDGRDISSLISKCSNITKDKAFSYGFYHILKQELDVFVGKYEYLGKTIVGVFNVSLSSGEAYVDVEDGTYENLIDGSSITVKDKIVSLENKPVIFKL